MMFDEFTELFTAHPKKVVLKHYGRDRDIPVYQIDYFKGERRRRYMVHNEQVFTYDYSFNPKHSQYAGYWTHEDGVSIKIPADVTEEIMDNISAAVAEATKEEFKSRMDEDGWTVEDPTEKLKAVYYADPKPKSEPKPRWAFWR